MDLFFELDGAGSTALALLAAAVVAGAFAQALTGIGFVLICGPAFVSVLGAQRGVAAAVLLGIFANLAPLVHERRDVHARRALLLLVPAVLATPLLALALGDVNERLALLLAGTAILAGTALLAAGATSSRGRGAAGVAAAGVASAAMNYLGGVGGPAAALYGVNAQWPAAELRATLQAYLLGLNIVTVVALGFVHVPLVLFAALLVGTALGVRAMGHVSEERARQTTLAISALGGAIVLVSALV